MLEHDRAQSCSALFSSPRRSRHRARSATKPGSRPCPSTSCRCANVTGSGAITGVLTGTKLTISGTFDGLGGPATIAQMHRGPLGIRGPAVLI